MENTALPEGWLRKALTSGSTETILSGFRMGEIILTRTDAESDDSHTEEEAVLLPPP